jgi:predicted nucleic acid-binding protein
MERVWELRDNLTAYDAVYVALTEVLEGVLLTCDGPLSRAPGSAGRVVLVKAKPSHR